MSSPHLSITSWSIDAKMSLWSFAPGNQIPIKCVAAMAPLSPDYVCLRRELKVRATASSCSSLQAARSGKTSNTCLHQVPAGLPEMRYLLLIVI